MNTIKLPYGQQKLELKLDNKRLGATLVSKAHQYKPETSEEELVKKSLANPIGQPRLRKLAQGKKKIVIISSDHTRPVPSHITMPLLLEEIRNGNPEAEITILVATGFHRPSTQEELKDKYGAQIIKKERIINHDSRDTDSLVKIGVLPSGGELILNKLAVEADLLVAEGFIEPHFFAGFSGGRKSILPGVASKDTVLANHCAEFIGDKHSRTGILADNPLHQDMLYAARQADLAFILNVVIDAEKKIINAFAGHYEKAHLTGCQFVRKLAGVSPKPADIVITTNGGYPLDQNIYQSVKGMTAAEATCKEGGVIIMVAECSDGHGGESFYQTFANTNSAREVMEQIKLRGRKETIPDQWESQVLARLLLSFEVIMVTKASQQMVEDMKMRWAANIEQALAMADKIVGNNSSQITVIPDGVSVIVK